MYSRPVVIGNRKSGGMWWRIPVAVLLWLSYAAPLVGGVAVYLVIRDYAQDLPRIPDLERWEAQLPRSTVIAARDGTVLARLPFQRGAEVGHRHYTRLADVPEVLIRAFLAAEDVRYPSHRGVDVRAVVRAARANYRAGRVVEGASTITQQLARGLLPETLGSERSLRRKVREALVAFRLERHYSKVRILESYLNFVFLGAGAYGVEAAGRAYFDKELAELTLAEAAMIAGLAQAPGRADPYKNRRAARERRDEVLGRMERAGFIELEQADRARASAIALHPPAQPYGRIAGWHTERVRQDLERDLPEAYRQGGLRVTTAAEPALALAGEEAANHWLERRWSEQRPQVGALVWDFGSGYVELTIGGRSWQVSKFDRATQACRQPGSAFKPLVYTAAIEKDAISPGTPLRDAPIAEFDWDLGVHWKPTNSGRSFRGVALAIDALASSLNAPAVDVFDRVGASAVVQLARRFGVSTELTEVRPLALGSSCVIPLELASVYASLAGGGQRVEPIFAVSASRLGLPIFDRGHYADPYLSADRRLDRLVASVATEPEQVVDRVTAFLMRTMLRAVVVRGTGVKAR
ncbi:MAG: transglycosylase domain-containing protein, partial [Deltaproteobacteria bacterium]|nr:transglycosylase domain-containing protein [Deltaproteobacteria bacterium]